MPKTKTTLTIGIPAHNEAQNIAYLLQSLFQQQSSHFELERIYILCDGCTDNTADIAKQTSQDHPEVVVLNDHQQKGKAGRVNQLFKLNQSAYVLTIDADVVFTNNHDLDTLVAGALNHPEASLIGPRYIPVPATTFMGKCAVVSYLSFEVAIQSLNHGQNIYALMGCVSLVKKDLADQINYPKSVVSDQNYLYMAATLNNPNGFWWERQAGVYFRTVTTFHDWRVLSTRSVVGDKESVFEHFGQAARDIYFMPRQYVLKGLLVWFLKSPIYTVGSVLLNIYIRLFPYNHKPVDGKWELATSSKAAIVLPK